MARTNRTGERSARGNARQRQRTSSVSPVTHDQGPRGENSNSKGILRLPDDILGEISVQFVLLHLAADPFDVLLLDHDLSTSFYSWLVITHICRRWRVVAHATPYMWATIKLVENTECVETMLKLSGQVPLTIFEDMSSFQDETLSSKEFALREMHRIKKLRIVVDTYTCAAISKLSALDAPLLHTLDICYNDRESDTPFDSIPKFSSWTLPSLARLAFRERSGRLNTESDGMPQFGLIRPIVRPTLTRLRIDSLEHPISVDTCLDLLRTLPRLVTLALGNVLSSTQDVPDCTRPPAASRVISHQCLREIYIQRTGLWMDPESGNVETELAFDSGVAAADLLHCLDIPASTSIYFTAGYERLSRDALSFIFSVLRDKANGKPGNPCVPFLSCTVNLSRIENDYSFLVQLNSKLSPIGVTQSHTGLQMPIDQDRTVHIVVRRRCQDDMDAVLAFFAFGFPLSDILTMRWYGASDALEENYWPTILQAVPALQELAVKTSARGFMYAMHQALTLPVSTSLVEAAKAAGPFIPQLKTLKIEDANWCRHGSKSGRRSYVNVHWELEPLTDQLIHTLTNWYAGNTDKSPKVLENIILESPNFLERTDLTKIESSGVAVSVICSQIPLLDSERCETCRDALWVMLNL